MMAAKKSGKAKGSSSFLKNFKKPSEERREQGTVKEAIRQIEEVRREEEGASEERPEMMSLLRTPNEEVPQTAEKPQKQAVSQKPKKRKITLYLREEHLHEIRQAVLDLGAADLEPSSVSAFTDQAIQAHLEKLREEHNKGKPWKLRKKRLPSGRAGGGLTKEREET